MTTLTIMSVTEPLFVSKRRLPGDARGPARAARAAGRGHRLHLRDLRVRDLLHVGELVLVLRLVRGRLEGRLLLRPHLADDRLGLALRLLHALAARCAGRPMEGIAPGPRARAERRTRARFGDDLGRAILGAHQLGDPLS